MVCGVAVSPGVPRRSVRDEDVASRRGRSLGSFLRSDGGGDGAGARSPGRMPALRAAAVGRSTLT